MRQCLGPTTRQSVQVLSSGAIIVSNIFHPHLIHSAEVRPTTGPTVCVFAIFCSHQEPPRCSASSSVCFQWRCRCCRLHLLPPPQLLGPSRAREREAGSRALQGLCVTAGRSQVAVPKGHWGVRLSPLCGCFHPSAPITGTAQSSWGLWLEQPLLCCWEK